MTEKTKAKLFFGVWLIVVIGVICWLAVLCANGMTILQEKKMPWRDGIFVSKGDGALALISRVPKYPAVIPPPKLIYPPHYFAATAIDDAGLESDCSNEASFTNRIPGYVRSVTLGWDASPSTNRIVNYRIYHGRVSGAYTNSYSAGTNLSLSVSLTGPALTNVVITVTSQNATNLQWCSRIGQPWTLLGATNWTATNPAPRMWRAMGRRTTPGKAFISARWQ